MANAPIADGVHPTLVFAPGLGLSAADYTSLLEDLASFGYVVAGIDPTYSTDVVLSGDRVVPSINKARDNADYSQLVSLWAADIRFVATMLTTLSRDSGSPFGGHVDVQRIGFFGHSAGGAAATEACRMDESCVAAVDMDGDLAGDVAQLGLGKPFLFIGHDGATSSSALRSELRGVMRDAPQENGIIIEIRHTQHEDFTDRAAYFNFLGSQLGFLGSIDGFRALEITRRYLRAAFGAWLLQRPDDVLIYSSAAYPEVSHITL
jgi:hypothetical protein